jgi:hypothetical protein
VTVALELGELEDRHEPLADLEPVEPRRQLARAATPEIVEQVVAVGSDPKLAEPSVENRSRRGDVDSTVR